MGGTRRGTARRLFRQRQSEVQRGAHARQQGGCRGHNIAPCYRRRERSEGLQLHRDGCEQEGCGRFGYIQDLELRTRGQCAVHFAAHHAGRFRPLGDCGQEQRRQHMDILQAYADHYIRPLRPERRRLALHAGAEVREGQEIPGALHLLVSQLGYSRQARAGDGADEGVVLCGTDSHWRYQTHKGNWRVPHSFEHLPLRQGQLPDRNNRFGTHRFPGMQRG